jgi:nicotinamidase-related amidase
MTFEPFKMLDPAETVALLVDHQAGLMLFTGDIDPVHLRSNSIALAKVLKLHGIPVVMTAAAMGPLGPLGPILPEIAGLFPDQEPIYRTKINSWQDPRIRSAIEATGRKQVVCAGITADFCIGIPAKTMAAEGYDVRLVMDASGNDSTMVMHAAIANLTRHGVKVTNWLSVACELLADWAQPELAAGLLDIYRDHLPQWAMLELIKAGRDGAPAT